MSGSKTFIDITYVLKLCKIFKGKSMKTRSEVKSIRRVRIFATPWTIAYQDPQAMGFFKQEYWSGWPFAFPGDLPNPGIEPGSPALQAEALPSNPPRKPWKLDVIFN